MLFGLFFFWGGGCLVSRREYGCCRKGCSNMDRKPWLFLEGTRSEIQEHNRGDRSVFSLNRLELAAPFIQSLLNARLSTDQVIVQNKWVYSGVAPISPKPNEVFSAEKVPEALLLCATCKRG